MSELFKTKISKPGDKGRIDRTDLFWLAYLVFFVIEPLERRSAVYWGENLLFLVVFLAMYLRFLQRGSEHVQVALITGMALLGAAAMPLNGGGTAFIIYAGALLPFVVRSGPLVLASVAGLVTLVTVEGLLLHYNPWAIFINAFFTIVVSGTNFHFSQKARADCKLRMQQEEIEALAALAERERIARDLHDVLGHTLSVIVLKAELAGRLLDRELATPIAHEASSRPFEELPSRPSHEASSRPSPSQEASSQPSPSQEASPRPEREARSGETPAFASARAEGASLQNSDLARIRAEIGDVERTARTALTEVREAIGGYRARGLGAEIEAARRTLETAGVTLTTEGALQPATLTAAEETVLALALREAVTNIVRHAHATTCRLRLLVDDGVHRLSIEDNGHNPEAREGNGLRGMRERVESLGGQLSLIRENGTSLLIVLPQRAEITT